MLQFYSPLSFFPLQYPSHSDSSLATGSSEGSLQTTLEEGLSFSVSPPQNLPLPTAPLPLVCPVSLPEDSTSLSSPVQTLKPRPTPSSALTLQATRGHQRSQSSGRGSTSPGYTRDDSIDPSDEDLGIGIGSSIGGCGSSQAGNSEHLSETLSSLSLTSLLSPSSLVYPGGAVKKCNSTGSLDQGGMLLSSRGREGRREILGLELMDPQGFLANPWTGVLVDTRRGEGRVEIEDGEQRFKGKSSSQTTVGPCRKNRWNLLFTLPLSLHSLDLNPLLSLLFSLLPSVRKRVDDTWCPVFQNQTLILPPQFLSIDLWQAHVLFCAT